ncbi:uncharacterized protein [Venturia canescens]|uniref:uncharacterized protein n=1 Tax=Venturia canescens TaxID=32260 RepID=UPI001C9C7D3C|nr:uncharacterized protein LOC122419039 [Venturia canescens]XP_043289215.1 uncharacterized protein LOC122419039 [Venturia canescens]
MLHCFLDHVAIIFADLTWFNVFSTLICFSAVIATIWAGRINREENKEPEDEENFLKFGYQARFKLAKQKLIEKDLTPQQRNKEKESESETLNAVLKLIQERNDIFSSPTMDDLKEQLSLYRAE